MDILIDALEDLYNEQGNSHIDPEDGWTYFNEDNDKYQKVQQLCTELLFTESGECNWGNIIMLRIYGFYAASRERGEIGWLEGTIVKDDDYRTVIYKV